MGSFRVLDSVPSSLGAGHNRHIPPILTMGSFRMVVVRGGGRLGGMRPFVDGCRDRRRHRRQQNDRSHGSRRLAWSVSSSLTWCPRPPAGSMSASIPRPFLRFVSGPANPPIYIISPEGLAVAQIFADLSNSGGPCLHPTRANDPPRSVQPDHPTARNPPATGRIPAGAARMNSDSLRLP